MARAREAPRFGIRGFQPSIHLLSPLVLLSCLIASTAAPAAGGADPGGDGALGGWLERLSPGFVDAGDTVFGPGGVAFRDPVSGDAIPSFRFTISGALASIDARSTAPGTVLLRSGSASSQGAHRLIAPLALRWSGTESRPASLLNWPVGTLFDNVVNGFTGGWVPFRIGSRGTSDSGSVLPIAAEPTEALPAADSFRFSQEPIAGGGELERGRTARW